MNTQVVRTEPRNKAVRLLSEVKKRKLTKQQEKSLKTRKELGVQVAFRDNEHPIGTENLSHRHDITRGTVQRNLTRLIIEEGQKIGSCEKGFYLIKTAEDRERAIRWLKMRAFKILLRCAVISEEHVANVFMSAWEDYYESRHTKTINRNLKLLPQKRIAGLLPQKKASGGNGTSEW